MKEYRVLIPNPITNNPFVFQLLRGLQHHPQVEVVQYGSRWLHDRSFRFDVVLIQWPEAMLDWREPEAEDLDLFREALGWWRESGAAVAATVHNVLPHFSYKVNEYTRELYREVYNHCDAIVHMGEASRPALRGSVEYEIDPEREVIIPHGNYEFFGEPRDWAQARSRLGWGDELRVLTLGTIRSDAEMSLLRRASKHIGRMGGRLVVSGRLPHTDRKTPGYYRTRLPLLFNSHLETEERFLRDREIPRYLAASDILFVPRLESLNSGNVILGCTFGKVVVGPDTGVTGEELKRLGNPVFEPGDDVSLGEALEEAVRLTESGLGTENRRFMLEERNWEVIAGRYVDLFNRVKRQEA